jgi:SAM-dependent methyltransferase
MYDDPRTLATERSYPHANGWVDGAEQAAILSIANRVRGCRILDVGVGVGRTVGLLSLLSDQYVGIDFSPRRVEACRQRFPSADIRVGDARDLSHFGDNAFDFVFFSFNGIDTLQHEERTRALAGFHRLLAPNGILSYSTLNRDGPSYGESPWQLHRPGTPPDMTLQNALRHIWLNVFDPMRFWRRSRNWLRKRRESTFSDQWSTGPLAAFDFGAMQHFTTLGGLRSELVDASFKITAIYESEFLKFSQPATMVMEDATTSKAGGFHVVATRSL